jgi:hypothetical protein
MKKINEFYNYFVDMIKGNMQKVHERIDIFSINVDRNFGILTDELMNTRKKLSGKIAQVEKDGKEQFKSLVEDIESVAERVYSYEEMLADYDKQNVIIKEKLDQDIAELISKIEVKFIDEGLMRKIEYEELKSENAGLRDDLVEFGKNINGDMNEIMKNFEANYQNLFDRSKLTFEQINKMSQNYFQMFEEIDRSIVKLGEEVDANEVANLMNQMLDKIENSELRVEIGNNKQVEHYLHGTIHELSEELKNFQTIMYQNHENVTQTIKNNRDTFEKMLSGNEEGLQRMLLHENEITKAKMREMEENVNIQKDVSDLMNKILKQVESNYDPIGDSINNITLQLKQHENKLNELSTKESNKISKVIADELDKLKKEMVTHNEYINEIQSRNAVDNILAKVDIEVILGKIAKYDETAGIILSKLGIFNEHISKIDKEFSETNGTAHQILNEYNTIIENKINSALEKIKRDNVNMWTNAVELSQTFNTSEDIRRIIKMVPPVVIPKKESMQSIYDIEHERTTINPKPKLLKFNYNDPRNNLTDNAKVSVTEKPFSTIEEAKKMESKKSLNSRLNIPITVNEVNDGIKQNPNSSNKQLPENI